MALGRRASHRAGPRGSRLRRARAGAVGLALASVILFGAMPGAEGRSGEMRMSTRAVLSSLAPGSRALTLSTASLYARNDRWKAHLASESVCPGGERTDLPAARRVATVACLVNYARKRQGLRELAVRPLFNGASESKAKAIVLCGNFAHNPCGGDWASAVRAAGYEGAFGENLYLARGRWGAPRVAVDAWLNSDPHRENLFGREWRGQGLAVLSQQDFGVYRDVFVWVSVFGDR